MSDYNYNEQDELFNAEQAHIEEKLSFLTQAREQMRSYNERFSAQSMEENFLAGITPPDPFEELIYDAPPQDETEKQAPAAPPRRHGKRKKCELGAKLCDGWNSLAALWHKLSRPMRIGIAAGAAILLCLILLVIPFGAEKAPTIRRGVKIDGVSVSGMTREEAIEALSKSLDEKVAGTRIILTYAGQSWTFDSTALGLHHDLEQVVERALSFDRPNRFIDWITDMLKRKREARNLETSIVVSETMLRTTLAQTCGIADETVVEGGVTFDPTAASEAGLFTITAPRSGRTIDFTRLVADIRIAANEGGVHTIAICETATSPKYTLSELKLSVNCIAQVSMNVSSYDDAQFANITSALSHLNGVCIQSDKNFSFNTYAAPYSGENGYTMTRDGEGEYRADGINAAATVIYRAGLLADLKLLTRFCPDVPVQYDAAGLDAAVGPMQDLVFKNESAYPIYICTSVVDGIATVTVYGMPYVDGTRIHVETEIITAGETPAPKQIVNDGSYTLEDGQPLDIVQSTPKCTVRTWRIYTDKFEREISRQMIGADSNYEEVVGTRIVAAQ